MSGANNISIDGMCFKGYVTNIEISTNPFSSELIFTVALVDHDQVSEAFNTCNNIMLNKPTTKQHSEHKPEIAYDRAMKIMER